MPADPPCTVVVGESAGELRRSLGATSWMVLEELLRRSTGDDGVRVTRVSVRGLARSLGLAKGTVAAAVGRLRDAGLVAALQDRDEAGQFAVGCYRVCVPADVLAVVPATAPVASTPTFQPSRRRAPRHTAATANAATDATDLIDATDDTDATHATDATQLSLLELT
jgi:hypothetical protein